MPSPAARGPVQTGHESLEPVVVGVVQGVPEVGERDEAVETEVPTVVGEGPCSATSISVNGRTTIKYKISSWRTLQVPQRYSNI